MLQKVHTKESDKQAADTLFASGKPTWQMSPDERKLILLVKGDLSPLQLVDTVHQWYKMLRGKMGAKWKRKD